MVPTVDDDAVDDAACVRVRVCVVGGRLFVQVGGLENCGFALWGGAAWTAWLCGSLLLVSEIIALLTHSL